LKKHNLAKSHNFRSPTLKIKGRWGAKSPQRLAIFEISQLKFSLKNWNLFSINS